MRLEKYNKSIGMLSLFASTVMLSGCNTALMDPKGAIGHEQRTLILTAIGLMLIVVIPVIIMAFAFAWKYRASNKDAKYSPNWSHSNKIEAVVWTVPIIIIAILATITWKTTHSLDPFKPIESDQKPLTIEVVALDWKWLFIYPEQGIATVNEIAIPKNVPVQFKVTSDTVMNSFFIPQLGGQIYAMAGMQTQLHLIANEAGTYKGISSNFSGRGFSGMKFNAIATPNQQEFDNWVAKVKQAPNTLNSTDEFNKLAAPSEAHPVEYFSSVKSGLFQEVIGKFMGEMKSHKDIDAMPDGMDMSKGMDMGEHAKAGAEE
ncbi:MAG: cytochrome o ubiquinol oxidase subunit II [Yersiniaceae bacterium]|uniref:Ubiquinol oxidase subunit 2 n=1 Tax=Chimaeribacter coloradensis TaxID=2060068 RepID=A0A2N5EB18_9GAMM|nr:cytochrome o ubiquinol oxidase subunit II [Chimaeribacter coloradensis]MDU6409939.1 cytochrome o ubiquinol oxidase subunit II [Yersiniaceae bacterium]PLR39284.1 cytochrome o ubiquinol oxidase subunit II [Chimaeribacter coloradensis]